MTFAGSTILVVDDQPVNRRLLQAILSPEGATIVHAESADEALLRLEQGGIDLILLDVMMPGTDGIEACRLIRQRADYIPVVLVTALADSASRVRGKAAGADDFLTKPIHEDELLVRVRTLLTLRAHHVKARLESERWRVISEVATAASTSTDQSMFIARLMTALANVVELDCVGIVDVSADAMAIRASCGHIPRDLPALPLSPTGHTWLAEVRASGHLRIDADGTAPFSPLLGMLGLREAIVFPVEGAGMLHQLVVAARKRPFTDDEVRWLEHLGVHIGNGANNVRLHMHSERLLQARDQLGRFILHDVRNILVAIQMNIDLANEATCPDDAHAMLGDARAAVTRLSALSTELLEVGAAEDGVLRIDRRPTDLGKLATEALHSAVPRHDVRAAVVGPHVVAPIDERLIRRLFENVLGNAARYAPPSSRIEVQIESFLDRVVIAISNEGPPIPARVRERLFEKYATDGSHRTGGLGLYFCRLVAEAHCGTIRACPIDVGGARIEISLPLVAMAQRSGQL